MKRSLVFCGGILLAIAACGGETSDGEDPVNCDVETRADTFVVGLEKTGQQLTFRLLAVEPSPPARGDNKWTVQIESSTGPVTSAALRVTPFMPDHGHGTSIPVGVTALPEPGQYELMPINLWMPALWETTISATSPTSDSAVFRVCIPG